MHYDSGDLISYFTSGAISFAMVIREMTADEISALNTYGSAGAFTAPVFWIVGINNNNNPPVSAFSASGEPQAGFVRGSAIATVIKASGDSDAVAGLVT